MATNQIGPCPAVYVADLVLIRPDGTELLWGRKIYLKPGPAKAMRTRWTKWASTHTGQPLGWGSQFRSFEAVAYAITPNGYEDIP